MSTDLWKSINYKTPIIYLINTYIREYDLSKANISALLFTGRISAEEHASYLTMDKRNREAQIGLMIQKDSSIYQDIQKGIIEAKRRLVFANEIEDFDVVSVKNDAMFISGKNLQYTEFPPFKFSLKNTYTIFMRLQDLEVYYGDSVDFNTGMIKTNIDVKGIPDKTLSLHSGGILDLICDVCYKLQRENIVDTMTWLGNMFQDFISRKLPKEFYRNFDPFSGYTLNTFTRSVSLGEIDDTMINVVDINRNLLILRDLMGIVMDIYKRSNQ